MQVTAEYLYNGFGDYWHGYATEEGREALLFTYYGPETTLKEVIEGLVEDSWMGADSERIPEGITEDDVRTALLDMLTPEGRIDYDKDELFEFAKDLYDSDDPTDDNYQLESPIVIAVLSWED